jgi:hypothetical protein
VAGDDFKAAIHIRQGIPSLVRSKSSRAGCQAVIFRTVSPRDREAVLPVFPSEPKDRCRLILAAILNPNDTILGYSMTLALGREHQIGDKGDDQRLAGFQKGQS